MRDAGEIRRGLSTPTGPAPLARKPNYSFEKRKRELDRKAKKDARDENRRKRKAEGATDEETPETTPGEEAGAPVEGAEAGEEDTSRG